MENVRSAITQKVLQTVNLQSVDATFDACPAVHISNFLARLRPRAKKSVDQLSDIGKTILADRLAEFTPVETMLKQTLTNSHLYNSNLLQTYLTEVDMAKVASVFNLEEQLNMFGSNMFYAYNDSVKKWLEEQPSAWLLHKINLSSWHHGGRTSWNTAVNAYNCIAKFDFGQEFTVTIDTSNGYNNKGYSKYSRTFLDAELAFLIHYQGEHVLTVSFNIIHRSKEPMDTVQIRQIQCKRQKGNRWLYKLEGPLLQHTIATFMQQFPGFKIQLIRGETLVEEIVQQYEKICSELDQKLHQLAKAIKTADVTDDITFFTDRQEQAQQRLHRFNIVDSQRLLHLYNSKLSGFKRSRSQHCKYYHLKQLSC